MVGQNILRKYGWLIPTLMMNDMRKTYIGHPLWSNMDEITSYKAEPKNIVNDADCQYIITFKEKLQADIFVTMLNDNAESLGLQGQIFRNSRAVGWGYHHDIYRVVDLTSRAGVTLLSLDFDMTGFVSTE